MSSTYSASSQRPTLPPLRTLNLLPPSCAKSPREVSHYDLHEHSSRPRLHVPQHSWPHINSRRVSTSSSTTSQSRTPSPTPSDASSSSLLSASSSSSCSPYKTSPHRKLSLFPSSLEEADAIVVVPADPAAKSLLLTGRAVERLRQRQIAPHGARLHPYRFCPRTSGSHRRASVSSSVSSA
ncbi:hypothetical protein FB45DRAFT_865328 [Roridomyces roridus]|uniref:Uncharacterized protein n=1 Tax=Roridomyces roridus TaxID=1738132 RepID=A0AAD7FR48_9AGAR|nr:hypothetical protein FB45DRAFT_865328 [Roridomyces roridus]